MQYSHAAFGSASNRYSIAKETSDQVLIGLVAQGDKHAMQVLFARHNVKVFRFLVRLVGNEATAEDLVNEVFIDASRHADRFEARSQLATWLLAIARHKALSALRQRSTDSLDEDVISFIEDSGRQSGSWDAEEGLQRVLRECLSQLSPAHREIIDLVYYHDRTIDDVAEIIGVPQNTVKTRMFYARKRIAEMMAARGVERAWL